jgi:hypothetical protein
MNEITFVLVDITLRVEITLCVYKLHSACINHTQACRNDTRECQNYTRVCGNYTLRVKSHSADGNFTLRVEINLVRVEITLVRFGITFSGGGGNYLYYKPPLPWIHA